MDALPQNIDALTQDVYAQLLEERNELIADLKTVKVNITKIVTMLGILNEDGTLRGKPNISKILSLVSSVAMGKSKDEFDFLQEFLPLIEKYKDL
jgi:hypothetical protein